MKAKFCSTVLALAVLTVSVVPATAQRLALSPSSNTLAPSPATAEELREGIRELAEALGDASTPLAERESKYTALQAQRVRLYALLRKRVNALRAYQGTVTSPAEKVVVEKDIENRLGELRVLEREMQASLQSAVAPRVSPLAAASASSLAAPAQTPRATVGGQIRTQITSLADDLSKATAADRRRQADLLGQNTELVLLALARRASRKFVGDIEDLRVDKQVGGGSENAGSTSLVSKGAAPAILGFAVENGALTQTISGTTITYRGNLVGTIEALKNTGFSLALEDDSPATKLLRKLYYSFSFDTSRGNQVGTFVGDRQQLSSYSFRYELKNDRDPRGRQYQQKFDALADADLTPLTNLASSIGGNMQANALLDAWNNKARDAIAAKSSKDDVQKEIIHQLDEELPPLDSFPADVQQQVQAFASHFEALLKDHNALRELISQGALLTVEYTGDRRVGLVDTSNVKIIAEGDLMHLFGFGKGTTEVTYNGAMTFFNSRPGPGMRRLRDFDHSLQLDYPFITGLGSFVLSFAGKYKRLTENDLAPGSIVLIPGGSLTGATLANIKGDIASGQIKLTVPLSNGMRIPISLTLANRTELIKEREVRGNFGFTFDLDSLFARRRP